MSADPRGKRLTKEQREAIIRDLRAAKKSMRSISVDHNCSISTVSKIAAELGIPSRRGKKSKPTEQPDHSYDKPRRIAVLDRMLKSIEDTIAAGGLNTKQLFDLARSARELTTSRRGEDMLPDGSALDGQENSLRGSRADYTSLVGLNERGVPRNLEIHFGLLDLQGARVEGNEEKARDIEDRVRTACRKAGLPEHEINFDAMIKELDKDLHESPRREGPLEYQGEGL